MPDTTTPQEGVPAPIDQSTWCRCPHEGDLVDCAAREPGLFLPNDCTPMGQCCVLAHLASIEAPGVWDAAAQYLIDHSDCEGCGDE